MKAFQMTAPGVAGVVQVPDPVPCTNEVLLHVKLVGLCGTDLNTFRGRNTMVSFPRVPGHEVCAEVVEGHGSLTCGTLVTVLPYTSCGECASCRRGRVNACESNQTMGVQRDGAMKEYISVPPEKLYVGNLSATELCLVEPLTVGFHAVSRGRAGVGETAAIFGCGGVGLGAITASVASGADTIAIDMDDAKLEIARKIGARHLINTRRQDLRAALREITSGRGPDLVVEAIGLPETFRAAVEEVAFSGRVVYIGYAKEPVSYETRLFVQKELDILGSRNALPEDFHAVIRVLEAGRFPVESAVSATVTMEETAGMLKAWSDHPGRFTKIMVSVS